MICAGSPSGRGSVVQHELGSESWVEMHRDLYEEALRSVDLTGISFSACEEYTSPPAALLRDGEPSIGWHYRIADCRFEMSSGVADDVDVKVTGDWAHLRAMTVLDREKPEEYEEFLRLTSVGLAEGTLKVLGDPASKPEVLAALELHGELARRTAGPRPTPTVGSTLATSSASAPPTDGDAGAVDGTYQLVLDAPQGQQAMTLSLSTEGGVLSGAVTQSGEPGEQAIENAAISGGTVSFSLALTQPMPLTLAFEAVVEGDVITGTAKVLSFTFPFTGKAVQACSQARRSGHGRRDDADQADGGSRSGASR